MPGIIFVLLIFLLGRELVPKAGRSRLWLFLPASFGLGTLALGWASYGTAFLLSVCLNSEEPLLWGNMIVMTGTAAFLAVLYGYRIRKKGLALPFPVLLKRERREGQGKKRFIKETVFFLFLLVFLTWIMFYVFYIRDGILYSGFTVYGDYAPHTAMMRSFSRGNNFPTQYPHFGGEDVKYHFMFQFLVGNLEYLGLRIDVAYNLLSVFALLGFLMVLYCLARRLTGSGKAGVLAVMLFFFRSSFTFFRYLWEHFRSGDLIKTLAENTAFIGYTPNEDWGLWNFNVYLNQRHLAFGLLIAALVLWFYLDWVEAGCRRKEKGAAWLKFLFFDRKAWKMKSPEWALAAGMMLGLTAFWNGAAVIGGLLILMGFAVFSDGKLDYLVTAATAVFFSVLQTRIFIRGSAVETSFYWGFISEDKSFAGVLWFLIQMSGIFFIGVLPLLVILKKRIFRALTVSSLFPLFFAFCFSLTPDVTVNHKYIMISYAFLTILWAGILVGIWGKKKKRRPAVSFFRKLAAVLLAICFTATGIYDFVVILRNNGPGHRVTVFMDSALTDWLSEHLDQKDLILTPEYSMNEVTMSGVMMYLGWPYYAWSAGYDTYGRAQKAVEIYTSEDKEAVKELVKQEKITYILYEEGMEFEGMTCQEDTIRELYSMVYQSEDGRIRIYET